MIRPVDDRLAHSDQQEQQEVENDHQAEGVVVTLETLTGGQWRLDADASLTVECLQLHGLSAVVSLAALDHQTHSQL